MNTTITSTHFDTQRVHPQKAKLCLVGRVVAVSMGSGAKLPGFKASLTTHCLCTLRHLT